MLYDPVTLDIIWNRLISICDEAETGVMRTTFSNAVREGKDFCCLLLDTKGDSIAQGSLSLTIFLSAAPLTAKKMLEKFPAETLEPGDILVTNNPWVNPGHLYDVFALEPIFHRGSLLALAGCVMHWSDVGGRGFAADNRSIYEEGIQLPIMKLAKRGQFNEEVMEIIRENIRYPDSSMGDFRSQLIGNDLMRRKLIDLVETQGIEDFGALGETILGRSEAAMREAVAKIPDGSYENEVHIDGTDRPLVIKANVTVRGTEIHVDFAGTSDQVEWSVNSMPNYTYAYTFIGIKAAVAPLLPNNSGQMRPVTISAPVGSILNPRYRSVGAATRQVLGTFCCPVVFGALTKAIPEQSQAESPPFDSVNFMGVSADGVPFDAPGPANVCGMGARHNGDGIHAIYWPTGIRNTPVEMTEHHSPAILIEKKEIRMDSGGAGKYRGGCGEEGAVRIIDQASVTCQPRIRRMEHRPRGAQCGHDGVASRLLLNGKLMPFFRSFPMKYGDRMTVTTASGGGFGDPLERDPARVLEDVVDGLVSPERARDTYGVIVDVAAESLDLVATAELRRSRAKAPIDQSEQVDAPRSKAD